MVNVPASRRALVTGAASGIEHAIAVELATQGAEVILTDLPGERLTNAASEMHSAQSIGADLSTRDDVHRLAREAGSVDVLVNNAGFPHVDPIEEFDEAVWNRMLAVMLTAPFLLTQALIPGMYEHGWSASSTSPRYTAWLPPRTRPPTSPPSTVCWA